MTGLDIVIFMINQTFIEKKMKEYKCVPKGREKKATTIVRAKQQTKERCSNPVK